MAISIAAFAVKAMAQSLIDSVSDGTTNPPKVLLYSGDRPDKPEDDITTQTLIAEIPLNSNAFTLATETDAEIIYTAGNLAPVLALVDAEANFFRMVSAEGISILDGSITDSFGAGDMKISVIEVVQGWLVKVLSLTFKMSKI